MSSLFKNFNGYAKYGTVPAAKNNSEVPQNSFYKSVHYINSVIGPVKDAVSGVKSSQVCLGGRKNGSLGIICTAVWALTHVVLQTLYLALAYLSYWPAKGLAKVVDSFDLKYSTKSLIDYSSMLSGKAWDHSNALAQFVNTVLSYAVSAVIWAAALVVTPLVWAIDKVASKFSDANAEGVGGPSFSK
ncbi:hypothetical protein [Wolbachia endosymbiont (group B) of Camptogramma bilineatum]|uniref:hypothetical protein n=1 Tax=Wolbachia endosymbiont (group B) of Camptogramma bilineatum TaxID=2953991 RepID=UPI0022321C89|nr:hypothetical protein [Wolbachia endosymbiont (group B) of Camptogramma bilineatum]